MSVLGIAAFAAVLFVNARGEGYRRDQLLHIVVVGAGGGILGAHALFFMTRLDFLAEVICHPSRYLGSFNDFINVLVSLFGGMVYYGGLFGAVFAIWLYCRKLKIDFSLHVDAGVPGVPLFHAFGRVGCLFAGCCYGFESRYGWHFPYSPAADPSKTYFPIQLVESACNILLFAVLQFTLFRRVRRGAMLWWYGALYSTVRFVLEFFRGDAVRGIYFGLSTSQWISLAVFALSVSALIVKRIKSVNEPKDVAR